MPADPASELATAENRVRPVSAMEFATLLTPCLALCAPSGMAADDRTEWLKAARMTIGDLPADLLADACQSARLSCDHPAKIVPHIARYVETEMEERNRWLRIAYGRAARLETPCTRALPDGPRERAIEDERREVAVRLGELLKQLPDGIQ